MVNEVDYYSHKKHMSDYELIQNEIDRLNQRDNLLKLMGEVIFMDAQIDEKEIHTKLEAAINRPPSDVQYLADIVKEVVVIIVKNEIYSRFNPAKEPLPSLNP